MDNFEKLVSEQKPVIVTDVMRAGRNTDREWDEIKNSKMIEHLLRMQRYKDHFRENLDWGKYDFTIELEKLPNDEWHGIKFKCAFMDYEGRHDPAGYRIVSRLLKV